MTPSAIDFFAEAKARSLHKLDLYGKYLPPLVYKWGRLAGPRRPGRHIWIVDGFAGAGRYLPDDGGRAQDGSPLIAAKWARQVALDRRYPLVRCINVERDPNCFQELQRNLARGTTWRSTSGASSPTTWTTSWKRSATTRADLPRPLRSERHRDGRHREDPRPRWQDGAAHPLLGQDLLADGRAPG
jgi:hypothetical protein